MSNSAFADLEAFLADQPERPPVHLWQPELSGDIDIVIKVDGRWLHEGSEIKRHSLIKLFASILRCEADGNHYLVTPVEKWRIKVEECALQLVRLKRFDEGQAQQLVFESNIDTRYPLSNNYPLHVNFKDSGEPIPYLNVDNGLKAKLSRSVFYQCVELAEKHDDKYWLQSCGNKFLLS